MNATILLTRPLIESQNLAKMLRKCGFDSLILPVLKIEYIQCRATLELSLKALPSKAASWLIFTSANGVKALHSNLGDCDLSKFSIAVQGPGTALALEEKFKRQADFMPQVAVSENFAEDLAQVLPRASTICIFRGEQSRGVLATAFAAAGHRVQDFVVYQNTEQKLTAELLAAHNAIPVKERIYTFFSPSAVRGLLANFSETEIAALRTARVLSFGPITSAAVRSAGLQLSAECQPGDLEDFIEKLVALRVSL